MTDEEILPGVHRIDSSLGDRLSSLYLFVGEKRAVLFDAGVDGTIPRTVLPYAQRIGVPLSMIEMVVVSHCDVDHFGGIQDVHDYLPAAQVVAHVADADAMEDFGAYERDRGRSFRSDYGFDEGTDDWARSVVRPGRVDRRLSGDAEVDLGGRAIEILHTPGHTRGHLSLYDRDNAFIAIGDAILGDAVPLESGEPAFPPTYRHERAYLDSVSRVERLAVGQIGTAHYGCFTGVDGMSFLELSRLFALDLRQRVLAGVRRSIHGVSLEQLAVALDPEVGAWPKGRSIPALIFPIAAHLEQLEVDGVIRRFIPEGTAIAIFFDNR